MIDGPLGGMIIPLNLISVLNYVLMFLGISALRTCASTFFRIS